MADIELPDEMRNYLSEIGRRGGKAGKGKKGVKRGFALMEPARRSEIGKRAADAKKKKQKLLEP